MNCKNREFPGNLPGSIGIIARTNKKSLPEELKSDYRKAITREFMRDTKETWDQYNQDKIEKIIIEKRVEELFCQANAKLRLRRERLRDFLRNEENRFLCELSQQEDPATTKQKQLKETFCRLAVQRESERIAFVQDKYEQQFRQNSEELRNLINAAEKRSISEEYKEHIQRRRAMDNLKLEEEKIFLELWQRDFEERGRREEEDLQKKLDANREAFEAIKEQIAEQEARKGCLEMEKAEDLRLMEEELCQLKMEEEERKEAKKTRTKNIQEEYVVLMETKKNKNPKNSKSEDLPEEGLFNIDPARIAKENAEKKRELKLEQDCFLAYLKFVHEERLLQERMDEKVYMRDADAIWEKKREAFLKEKMKKDAMMREINEGWKKQIDEKFERKLKRQTQDKDEVELDRKEVEREMMLEKKEREMLRRKKATYKESLCSQIKYNREQHLQKLKEDMKLIEAQKQADMEYSAKVEDFRKRPPLRHLHPLRKPGCFGKPIKNVNQGRSGALN